MERRLARLALFAAALALLVGCEQGAADDDCDGPDDPSCGAAWEALSHPGDWVPDPAALEAGSAIISYDDSTPWDDGAHCAGGLTTGGRTLANYLRANFPGISSVGGYSCRQNTANTSQMSVHGSGRALDIMIPKDGGEADNDVGDRIGNWLIANSTAIGVQYLIWDRTQWSGSRSTNRVRVYTGPSPHIDHIHAEITLPASREETPWYTSGGPLVPVEDLEVCNGLDDDFNGEIDEGDVCEPEPVDAGPEPPDAWVAAEDASVEESPDAGLVDPPDAGVASLDDASLPAPDASAARSIQSSCSCAVVGAHERSGAPLASLTLFGVALFGVARRRGRRP